MPEYEKSKPGNVLPLTLDGKTIAQIDGRSFEQGWQVSDSPAALVGSSRHNDGGNRTRFALSYFRPGSRP